MRLVGFVHVDDLLLKCRSALELAKQPLADDRLIQTFGVIALGRHPDSMALEDR